MLPLSSPPPFLLTLFYFFLLSISIEYQKESTFVSFLETCVTFAFHGTYFFALIIDYIIKESMPILPGE